LAAFANWGRHEDPLYEHFNVRALAAGEIEDFWRSIAGDPARARPYAALLGERMIGTLVLRPREGGLGELGIVLDPAFVGRGLGRRILTAFATVVAADGFTRLRLEVGAYNRRAIAAYRAARFAVIDERWHEPEMDVAAVLAGPSSAALAPHVERTPDGRYLVRVLRMERRPEPS
jgi:RimJ/RimL family protein N-acetyltransferase